MDALTDKIDLFNEKYWVFVLFLLVGAGLYFCVRTVVVQLRYIPDMFKAVAEPPSETGIWPEGHFRVQGVYHFSCISCGYWQCCGGWRWLSRRVVQVLCSGCGH